jgi:glycosyltransferase involved in cell wall biosynthesis
MTFLGVASQTPLLQFKDPSLKQYPLMDISKLRENIDFRFSPGGVSRMLFPLLAELKDRGIIQGAEWIALNPSAPAKVSMDGLTLHNITLPPEKLKGYGSAKERIWRLFHSMEPEGTPPDFLQDEYVDYTYLNRVFSEEMHALEKHMDLDGYYVHDFQLLPLGHMLESPKPKIFRWHIPFMVEELPESWHGALLRYLNSYDAVIVSCKRYLHGLKYIGYKGPAYNLFPYLDPKKYAMPSVGAVKSFRERLNLKEGDRVILTVARLDPMKAQDKVIRALKKVASEVPEAKLVLVGNGSFSGSKSGIGLPKAELWLKYLEKLATDLRVRERVIFAGYVDESDLPAAYAMSDAFVLPSIREGFGLVVVEAWFYKKPTIVSSYAGVSDLISEGENGLTFDPMDEDLLAKKIIRILKDEEFAHRLGVSGFRRSRRCQLESGVSQEAEILTKYIGGEVNGPD